MITFTQEFSISVKIDKQSQIGGGTTFSWPADKNTTDLVKNDMYSLERLSNCFEMQDQKSLYVGILILWWAISLTLSGMGEGIFTILNLLDQILSADFFQKFPYFFKGENWDQSSYFDTLPSSLSLTKVAPW